MATVLHSESRKLYSWWWDSHISPKNSKWLQENLADMDAKIKAMIRLIEEDADSFARRAEMYYKKRPELMKLVEEFYRAYRALAERYDHATGELRQAHRTIAAAFPCQVPYVLADDPVSVSSCHEGEPRTPGMPYPICSFLDPEDLQKDAMELSSTNPDAVKSNGGNLEGSNSGISKKGLKQLNYMFGPVAVSHISETGEMNMNKDSKLCETVEVNADKEAETEAQPLKKALKEVQADMEAVFLQHKQNLEKLSGLDKDLKDAEGLDGRTSSEMEIKILEEALAKVEAERDAGLIQYNKNLETISVLENTISLLQEDAKGFNARAVDAEVEVQNLKQEISRLESEKEAGLLQYNQCLELISILESKISLAEENARLLNELTKKAETEVKELKGSLTKLNEEKYAAELRYEQCLERIAVMEVEKSHAEKDVKRLSSEILTGAAKLQSLEERCFLLERANESLKLEAENLVQKIALKDLELSDKESELERLQTSLQDERSQFVQVEATLLTLQKLLSQSQDEQRAFAVQLQQKLQLLNDLEASNFDLQAELRQVKEKNQGLNELNSTFSISVTNLRDENFNLKEINKKLEEEVSLQVAQTNSLQQEIYHLKEEIEGLHRRYQALLAQVQSVGLDPDLLSSSVKDLQDENMKLKEVCKRDWDEKEVLYEKLSKMTMFSEKNAALERSLLELNEKLEGSKEQVKELHDSCQLFQAEKSGIAAEKEIILSQLQIMTENVQKILEKNVLLENSLSSANVELEVCRTKSKGLEEFCEMLKNEKHNLLNERGILVSQLENVEHRLGNLERSFTRLEEKYTDLEKEKESTDGQVKEIWCHLAVEKQEQSCNIQSTDSRLAKLESQIHQLQDEWSKKHFEEDFAKAVNAQVEITILQKFIKDLEEKNLSVLIECQKHVEASKLSDKLIAELETENLEQQMELEFLLDEIEKLRIGIHQVYRSLQFVEHVDEIEKEQGSLIRIVNNIEDLKSSLLTSEDEKQQLMVENSVLLTLLEQLRSGSVELESEKNLLEQHFQIKTLQHDLLKEDNLELLEMNRELRSEVTKGQQREKILEGQLETKHEDLVILQGSYLELQEENRCLCQNFSKLNEEMHFLEVESSSILQEVVAFSNLSLVFENFGIEIAEDLREVHENLSSLQVINKDLKKKVDVLGTNLEMKEKMNIVLKETKEKLQIELNEEKDLIDQLNCQIFLGQDFLREKETELLEAKEKLKASNGLNAEHCRTIAALRRKCKDSVAMREEMENQILELSEESTKQKKEIECLHQTNTYLESQVSTLHLEVEEQRTKEENLSLELLERSNESELWEAEASSFYFDLQISSIREALLENKVHELTAVCERLGEQNVAKDIEMQQMKERSSSLETEIGGLKAHLSAYVPVIACLRQNIESLEQDTLLSAKSLPPSGGHTAAESVIHPHKISLQGPRNDESAMITDGISELLKLQSRIKAVQKTVVVENMDRLAAEKAVVDKMVRLETQDILDTKDQLKYPKRGAELPELRNRSDRKNGIQVKELVLEKEPSDKARTEKNTYEVSEVRNRMLMKDIQLDLVSDRSLSRRSRRQSSGGADQMLELWESAEKSSRNDPIAHTQKQATPMLETVSTYHPSRLKQRSKNSWSNLQIEKEVGVDKMEVSTSMIKEPNPEGNKGNILERVASDNKRLMVLQTTVRDLKETMERKKNSNGANDLEFQRLKRQLEVAEEAVLELVNASDRLTKDIEKYPSYLEENASMGLEEFSSIGRKRVTEKACKRSEKIERLHFDVQSIQYLLLKQEDDKKNKVRHRFSRSRTGVILRDFISSSKISKVRRRKSSFCGCVRPSNNEYRKNHLTEVLRQD